MNSRMHWVDYAKGIGIILVVYGHVARGLHSAGLGENYFLYKALDSFIYSFHMPLFFFLSGLFVLASYNRAGACGLWLSKLDTIFYPFVIWSLLQGCIEVLMANFTNGGLELYEVLQFFWSPRAQFWYLHSLFFCFLLSLCFLTLFNRRSTIMMVVFSFVLYFFGPLLSSEKVILAVTDYFFYFALGAWISARGIDFDSVLKKYAMEAFIIFFSVQLLVFYFESFADFSCSRLIMVAVSVISISFVCSVSVIMARKQIRYIDFIGSLSMHIFLMHVLFGSGVRIILSRFLGVESYAVHLIFAVFCAVLFSVLSAKIAQRLNVSFLFSAPLSRWVFGYHK